MNTPFIKIEHVNFQYEHALILKDITLNVEEGDFLTIIGPNGSGKSTLLKLILGLLKPTTGVISLFGEPVSKFQHREWIGYVSQKSNAFNTGFPATVKEIVLSGLAKKKGLFKRYSLEDQQLALIALKAVEMEQFEKKNIGELSGGQQQRVFIARALISNPKLLILDEPTVGIDHQHVQSFYDMLTKLNREQNITMVLVTHDVDTVSDRISHVACLNQTIHFHGFRNELNQMTNEQLQAWHGYPVRKVHQRQKESMYD